jgi:hypothetical protein
MTEHTAPHTDPHAAGDKAHATVGPGSELEEIKAAVMDSGDLASRAAMLATTATADLRTVTKQLALDMAKQQKQTLILMGIGGGLMIIAAAIFATMAMSLQGRITQLDAMVTVVGKRIGELDTSLELVGSVNDALQELVRKQEGIATTQSNMEGRLDEMAKTTQAMAEKAAEKPPEKAVAKAGPADPAMSKQVQSLDSRMQAQAAALKSIATQLQGLQGSVGDAGGLRREMEAVAKQQRDKQASENAAAAAALAAQRQREKMVQFPRPSANDAPLASPNIMGAPKSEK